MTGGAIQIGSIRGIPIRAHVTFLIVLPVLAFSFGRVFTQAARLADVPPDQLAGPPLLWGFVVAVALFLSVLVHELAHSLYALRVGGRVRDITLIMIGGVSQISELPRKARAEVIMAAVGPLTSLALGAIFYGLFRATRGTAQFNVQFVLFHLAYLNAVLGIFNLLPAFPLDGGRVLRGAIAGRLGLVRATRVAAAVGKAFAVAFAILGVLGGNLLLVVIAFFVYLGADSESRYVLVKALLGELHIRDVMSPAPATIDARATVREVGDRMIGERRLAYPVAGPDGSIAGVVTLAQVRAVQPDRRSSVSAGDVAARVQPLAPGDDASKAFRAFTEAGVDQLPVVEGGTLVGVLSRLDLARSLELQELQSSTEPRRRWPGRRWPRRGDLEQPA